jgi:carbamoyl-phosphate synthase large subunit
MNILLTSVGRRSYLVKYFREALKGNGLIHAANSMETYAMQLADKSVVTPLIYDESYIDFLLNYSIENNIEAIISLFDIDLPILANSKKRFEEIGVQVIVSDYETTRICNDKWLTYKFLIENGFLTSQTFLSVKEAIEAIDNKKIRYPLIIKPRWGMGSIGIFEAENQYELEIFYKKTQKKITESYLKYESQKYLNKSVVIQEKLEGEEYGLDIFNDLEGKFLSCIPKKKIAMRAGETDGAEIIDSPLLKALGKEISDKIKHLGNLDLDCFYKDNQIYILEMNCRFGGQYPFSHLAGVNFPLAIIQMLSGHTPDPKLLKAKPGIIGIKDIVPVKL